MMMTQLGIRFLAVGVAATGLAVAALPGATSGAAAWAPTAVASETEDVLYMNDGRELRGRIIEETRLQIVFEVIDRDLNITTEIRIFKDQIYKIDRNVAITGGTGGTTGTTGETTTTRPRMEAAEVDPSIPGIYIVPLTGQIGTDIYHAVYEPIIEDILAKKPACVVFKLNVDSTEHGDFVDFDEKRILITNFRNRLRGIRQVLWIENSVGVGSVLALSWRELYMKPDARLDGMSWVHTSTANFRDPDVRAKMQAAWSGVVRGFVEFGGHDLLMAEAMMFPEHKLSATFRGRDVTWSLDDSGEVVADNSDEWTVGFGAEDARNLLISRETVEEVGRDGLDDLAFILGFREYRKIDGIAEDHIKFYQEDWRKYWDFSQKRFRDYQDAAQRMNGADALRYIGQGQAALRDVLASMRKYYAVERMWNARGIQRFHLETWMQQLQQMAQDIRRQLRDGTGGGSGGPPGIPGGGGIGGGGGGG